MIFRCAQQQGDNIKKVIEAAKIEGVEGYLPGLFAKALDGVDVNTLVANIGSGGGGGGGGGGGAAAPAAADAGGAAPAAVRPCCGVPLSRPRPRPPSLAFLGGVGPPSLRAHRRAAPVRLVMLPGNCATPPHFPRCLFPGAGGQEGGIRGRLRRIHGRPLRLSLRPRPILCSLCADQRTRNKEEGITLGSVW